MKINLRAIYIIMCLCLTTISATAQKFYNLTSDDVRVDSVVPMFTHTEALPSTYRDSVYSFEIAYPEYAEMPRADVGNYCRITDVLPPATPTVETRITFDRKRPSLFVSFSPVVFREGKYCVLASFMLRRKAVANDDAHDITARISRINSPLKASDTNYSSVEPKDRYAKRSVLRSGKWAKIRVPSTGFYQLTDALVRKAGFSNPSKVKIYGYGGNLQNEVLTAADLINCDDLKEVPTAKVGDKRVFYGRGPVSWKSKSAIRTRNHYSDYGYYFLTEATKEPRYTTIDSIQSLNPDIPIYNSYQLHEVDAYSYLQGGRHFFDSRQVAVGDSMVVEFDNSLYPSDAQYLPTVAIAAAGYSTVRVIVNGKSIGTVEVKGNVSQYISGFRTEKKFTTRCSRSASSDRERIVLKVESGNAMRLDFVQLEWSSPRGEQDLTTATLPVPEYVYNITNQNHHADPQADMVIIIPTSQKLLAQAERLKAFHEQHDSLRVNIVPADELFNEFSSGTPDASAYRHYLKMLYDRATDEADQPKYLLLFGGSVWDNRMNTTECSRLSADDYLLAYEDEDSFDKRVSCVDDGFYATLDDGEGSRLLVNDKMDVAVGRFPVTNEIDAKTMVDKAINYATNANGGSWQNTIFFMGDDGDANDHMSKANAVADQVISAHPGYNVKKVMWDAYQMEPTASGNTYPEVTKAIQQQQSQGALIMSYVGHGSEWQFSHENVLHISDFSTFKNTNLPMWLTIGCDFGPFDRLSDNIGMNAVLNQQGGAVAILTSARTVYSDRNAKLHSAYMRHVLSYEANGKPRTIGEALRLAKNEATTDQLALNSRQYVLFGDPAMSLNLPTVKIVVDSICGVALADKTQEIRLKAGSLVTVKGHVDNMPDFNGGVTMFVRDSRETITCRHNAEEKNDYSAFQYTDRTKTIFNGVNRIMNGEFNFTFAVPKDINYSDESGLITLWAINDEHTAIAQGYSDDFIVGGSEIAANDSIGPSIYCYLNSPSFQNGGDVNPTPYFVAEITDRDGINASGAGIGHDMQLIIDDMQDMTYSLNDNFMFDFGSYTTGSTYYYLPELDEGEHTLQFRAWDIQNNMSVARLRFNVVKGQKPSVSISCTDNPAQSNTSFIIAHDRTGSSIDVTVEVFDVGGRILWSQTDTGITAASPYVMSWNLTGSNGAPLQTGVYLYRVKLRSEGAVRTSKAKKLIIVGNK